MTMIDIMIMEANRLFEEQARRTVHQGIILDEQSKLEATHQLLDVEQVEESEEFKKRFEEMNARIESARKEVEEAFRKFDEEKETLHSSIENQKQYTLDEMVKKWAL